MIRYNSCAWFKAAGRAFACYSLNHHGDNKVALTVNIGLETQRELVQSAPAIFFIPPYTGAKGWVGIELNKGLRWSRIASFLVQAYSHVVPLALSKNVAVPPFTPPDEILTAAQINPLKSQYNQAFIDTLRELCLRYPEVLEQRQFGNPAFNAGGKTFAVIYLHNSALTLQVWAGPADQQGLIEGDQRFRIPPNSGQNGWIDLVPAVSAPWPLIEWLLACSYRHFALKRMLKALDSR
jgi:hypothetical protein